MKHLIIAILLSGCASAEKARYISYQTGDSDLALSHDCKYTGSYAKPQTKTQAMQLRLALAIGKLVCPKTAKPKARD
jgi:hypothetical protein